MEPDEVRELTEDLAEELESMGRLPEAAILARDHLGDPERAVGLLSQVHALRLAQQLRDDWMALALMAVLQHVECHALTGNASPVIGIKLRMHTTCMLTGSCPAGAAVACSPAVRPADRQRGAGGLCGAASCRGGLHRPHC